MQLNQVQLPRNRFAALIGGPKKRGSKDLLIQDQDAKFFP